MASARRNKKMSTKTLITIIVVVAVVVIGAFFGVKALRSNITKKYGNQNSDEVKSAEVTVGSISTTVSGTGSLANQDSEDITIPSAVEISEIYVEAGDIVKSGDILAAVNSISVTEAMVNIQADIDKLDDEISALEKASVNDVIKSKVTGRVKKIYATAGTTLASTMYDKKALMLVSLDGYMAVDIETTDLAVGETVSVVTEDDKKLTGTVESVWSGVTTIIVTDEGTQYGGTVSISYGEDKAATGTLYIHEEIAITGYTGTTESISVSEEDKIEVNQELITLKNTDNTVNYQTILKKRESLENELQSLIVIYKEGAVYAKADGLVTAVSGTDDSSSSSSASSMSASAGTSFGGMTDTSSSSGSDTVFSISPTDKMTMVVSIDESEILSLSVGQEATVTVSSVSDDSFTGKITKIDKTGTSSSGVTSYSAVVEIDRTENMLEGMSASAVITIEGKEDALLVPTDAVKKTSSTAYVYTTYDEDTKEFKDMVEVTIGLSNGSYTEITSGLKEGDTVYYAEEQQNTGFNFGGQGGFSMPGGGSGSMPGGGNFDPSSMPGLGSGSGKGNSGFGGF